jgi:KaiC/GvpD/RAD55 family RecA-like ATPase
MAEKAQILLDIEAGGSAQTLGELEQRAEALSEALRGAELGSAEYKKLNQELVQTNRQVKNLELGFESLDNEQVASELGSVAGAVGDVTGAMILLGGENESLEQMAANIEQAIGVSMAFKGAIEGMSSAFKLVNNVLKTSPLFLLVGLLALIGTGIGFMIAKWDEFVDLLVRGRDMVLGVFNAIIEVLFGVEDAIETQSMKERKAFEERVAQQKEIAKLHKERLAQIKAERDAELEAFNDRQEIFDLDIARMEAEGKNSDALKRAKIEDQLQHERFVLESINKQIESWTQYYEDLFVMSGKSREDFINQMKGQGIDLERLQQEALDLVEEQNRKIFQAETELIAFERELREKNTEEVKEAVEEQKEVYRDLQAERLDFLQRLEQAENEYLDSKLSREQQEINAVRDKYFTLIEEAKQYGEDTTILEDALETQLTEITKRYEDERLALKKQKAKEEADARIESINKYEERAMTALKAVEDFNSLFHGKELARAKEKMANGERLTKSEIKRIKQEEAVRKLQALAQITADTARGVSGAIAAGAGVPFPGNLIAIGTGVAAVLSGAAQAAAVLRESVELPSVETTSDTLNETTDNAQNTPNVNDFNSGSTQLNGMNKVVVLESDITETQKNVAVIESQASFGVILLLIGLFVI